VLPALAFLIGTLSYTVSTPSSGLRKEANGQFFDPIRAFFVRSKLEGTWDLENYSLIKGDFLLFK